MTEPPRTATHSPDRTAQGWLPLVLWLGLAALQVGSAFALGGTDEGASGESPIYQYSLGVGSLVIYAILGALTVGIARLYPEPQDALGLRPFAGRWVGYAAIVVVLSLIVSAAIEPLLHGGEEQGLVPEEWRSDKLGPFVFNAIVIVTVVPLVEELFYRGLGVRVFSVLGSTTAVVGTALVFGFAHGILAALPPLVFFALGLAWIRLRADSVWPCVIAHSAYNGLGILAAVLTST